MVVGERGLILWLPSIAGASSGYQFGLFRHSLIRLRFLVDVFGLKAMTDRLGLAVFGAGRWGTHLIRNFLEHPRSHLKAVVETNPDLLAAVGDRFASYPGWAEVQRVSDSRSIWGNPDIGAVVIATPAASHFELVRSALLAGKHVLVEKPLTLDVAECEDLCTLAQRVDRRLMVDHTYLFHPAVEAGAKALQSGVIGDRRYGYAARTHLGPVRQDVDVLWDLAIHDIAIFNHWLQSTPIALQAKGQTWLQRGRGTGLEVTDRPSPAAGLADLVWLTLYYPEQFTATIHLAWHNPDRARRLALVGTRGTLVFDEMNARSPLTLWAGSLEQSGSQWLPCNQSEQSIELASGEPLGQVCDQFLAGVLDGAPLDRSDGSIGTALVRLLAAASRSLARQGELVWVA